MSDQLKIDVTVDASKATDGLGKVETAIEQVTGKTQKLTDVTNTSGEAVVASDAKRRRFLQSLTTEIATYGKARDEVLAYKAAQLGVTDQAQGMIDQLKKLKSDPIHEAANAMDHLNFSTVGAKRELLVLAHELSQGNYSKFGGSLMVLGERTDAMGAIMKAVASPIGMATIALAGVAAIAVKATHEIDVLRDSFQLTGNAAGLTVAGFDAMAASVAKLSNGRLGQARDALEALVTTGRFGTQNLTAMAAAVLNMERLTGQTTAEVVKDFEKMADGVAAWVAEHNKSMHFATLAQYEHIKAMEEAGNKTGAITEATGLLNAQLALDETRLGATASAWRRITQGASEYWNTVKRGLSNDPTEALQAELAKLEKQAATPWAQRNDEAKAYYSAELARVRGLIDAQNNAAAEKAKKAQVQAEGIAAVKEIDQWRQLSGTINLATREIEKFRAATAKALEADPKNAEALDAQKNAAKIEAAIRKKYDKVEYKAENKLTTAFRGEHDSMGADSAKLQDEIQQFEAFGKVVEKSRRAVLEFDIANGKLKGLDPGRVAQLRALASGVDSQSETAGALKSIAALNQKIATIQKEASAQVDLKDATLEAQLMAELENQKGKISAELYAKEAVAIKGVVAAKRERDALVTVAGIEKEIAAIEAEAKAQVDSKESTREAVMLQKLYAQKTEQNAAQIEEAAQRLKRAFEALSARDAQASIAALDRDTQSMIAKIRAETESVGLNALERKKLAAALELEKKMRDAIAKSPSQEGAIRAAAAKDIAAVQAEIDAAEAKQRSAGFGATAAYKNYIDGATNTGAQVQNLLTSAFKGAEDALVNFTKTGKLDFKQMADSIISDLIRIGIQRKLIAPLANSLFGTETAAGWSLFGFLGITAHANGGDPPTDRPSLVGEAGPELFWPKAAGTIIPNHALTASANDSGGQQPLTVIQNFTVGDVASISDVRKAVAGSEQRIAGNLARQHRYGGMFA